MEERARLAQFSVGEEMPLVLSQLDCSPKGENKG